MAYIIKEAGNLRSLFGFSKSTSTVIKVIWTTGYIHEDLPSLAMMALEYLFDENHHTQISFCYDDLEFINYTRASKTLEITIFPMIEDMNLIRLNRAPINRLIIKDVKLSKNMDAPLTLLREMTLDTTVNHMYSGSIDIGKIQTNHPFLIKLTINISPVSQYNSIMLSNVPDHPLTSVEELNFPLSTLSLDDARKALPSLIKIGVLWYTSWNNTTGKRLNQLIKIIGRGFNKLKEITFYHLDGEEIPSEIVDNITVHHKLLVYNKRGTS